MHAQKPNQDHLAKAALKPIICNIFTRCLFSVWEGFPLLLSRHLSASIFLVQQQRVLQPCVKYFHFRGKQLYIRWFIINIVKEWVARICIKMSDDDNVVTTCFRCRSVGTLKEWLGKGEIAIAVPLEEDIATSQTSVLTKSKEKKNQVTHKNNSKFWISLKRSIYLTNHYTAIPIRQDSYTREVSKWRENCCFSSRFGSVQIAWLIRIITTTSQEVGWSLTKGAKDNRGNGFSFKELFLSGPQSDDQRLKQALVL